MDSVNFTRMEDGTRAEYRFLVEHWDDHHQGQVADNVLAMLKTLEGPKLGYKIDRYQHSLQCASRALRDGAEEETVVCALLHDMGDTLAPDNHGNLAAAILWPYVSEENNWIVKHHGVFQCYYYQHHLGGDRNTREQFRGHPQFEACVNFCARWDQTSFDPDYDTLPIAHFEPMVQRIFAREPRGSY